MPNFEGIKQKPFYLWGSSKQNCKKMLGRKFR